MFQSEELSRHLSASHTIETESVVFAEWNMNYSDNVSKLGNYRYRPGTVNNQFSVIPSTYDPLDVGEYYTGATESDITIESGFDDQDQPTLFTSKKEKMTLLYSLEDCIKPHRPRSGINKLLYLGKESQYLDMGGISADQEVLSIARRPRYYLSSRNDQFKYWTSYRTKNEEGEQQFGVSNFNNNGIYYIYDAAPFVVYKKEVPTNKIVVKMQTNVGDVNFGNITRRQDGVEIPDPLHGYQNQTTPVRWKIDVLKGDNWISVMSFDQNSLDENGNPVIKHDGYVEISYGLKVPEQYRQFYIYAGELSDASLLPFQAPYGYTYLIKSSQDDIGVLKFYDGGSWRDIPPEYGWFLSSQTVDIRTPKITKTTDPEYFVDQSGQTRFREFEFIKGIRIVAETMNIPQCTFDLIEMSPRLVADLSSKVSSISITKTMSDLGNGSVPVGGILASNGSLELFDDDFSFNINNSFNFETNTGSIISEYVNTKVNFNFYQVVKNVEGYDYFIPIKSMYADQVPAVSSSTGIVSISLRDFFFYLESSKAPEILMTNVSLSYAVTLLLDYMGFSNYVFRRITGLPEIIIPFFFVAPDQNVAEILQQLAVASQTAMFFDEYNNLVVMSKEYLLPESNQREVDSYLYGQEEGENLPNIINIASEEKRVFNEGSINYTTRYIQRAISKYSQANYTDKYKTYGYKPTLLWEAAGREQLRSQNELPQQSQGFTLSAAPLNTDISSEVPIVVNGKIENNIIDVGEGIDNIASYQGYFYANGEIIKYDAMEYAIAGPIDDDEPGNLRWIKNSQEYQKYFSKMPFNGKMYPTGNLRIYTEPEYATDLSNGETRIISIKKHGRGQFGTPITEHSAGLDLYWSDQSNVRGCLQEAKNYLFNTKEFIDYPQLSASVAGKINESFPTLGFFNSDTLSKNSSRTGIIKNFRANKYSTELEDNYFDSNRSGTLQSSALVFSGPEVPQELSTSNFVSYVYKDLLQPYKHFGTRMRIIGKIESTNQKSQTPYGAFPIYQTQDLNLDDPEKNIQILGGAGGIAFNLNSETNNGYYFEIVSLTQDNVDSYISEDKDSPVSYPISDVSCTNNVVQGKTDREIKFVVGQKLTFTGLSDSGNPGITPLNGEYAVTGITEDKKSFEYVITEPDIKTLSITSASANGSVISYYVPRGDSRKTFIKSGDKINISGNSNSSFNISGAIVKSFVKSPNSWYFTVSSSATGSGTGGTATYQKITTPTNTTGIAVVPGIGRNNIANVYFYKILSDNKNEKSVAYSVQSNVLTLYFEKDVRFNPNEKIVVDASFASGEYVIQSVTDKTISFNFTSSNVSKTAAPGTVFLKNPLAIPYKLWSGISNILVDDGKFTGQYRFVAEENPTVFDLAAEHVNLENGKRFYLYINNQQVAVVDDPNPLPEYNNIALFVRGTSKCMFENVYALGVNPSQDSSTPIAKPISKIFGDSEIDVSESLRKYSLSGMIQKTYLSGINSNSSPSHLLYFEEFGTIMREVAYLNIKYDRAYPALYARMMKTYNNLKGYSVSGLYTGAYGADFLIFNCQDTSINLDDTTGNFLRIQGITFTQSTSRTINVDDYYRKRSTLSDPITNDLGNLINPNIEKEEYNRIINSRYKYGVNEFSIESPYIQTDDVAEEIFGWILGKVSVPKTVVGINTFATFNIQLGDILKINYKNNDGLDIISDKDKIFVVYNIEYNKSFGEETMTMYLVEA
jgi:hypothetical protein